MTLPTIAHFPAVPAGLFRSIGQKLAALGLTPAAVQPIVGLVQPIDPALRRPMRRFHLRRRRDPIGVAMRMLLFSDPVPEPEARAALGALLDPMLEVGLLARIDGSVVSPFVLGIVDDLFVFSDDLARRGEAVMGLGESTITLCRAAFRPNGSVEAALDLGCGAGTGALVLARCARRVVGTDINPRAIVLARANAAINGVTNVAFREGDLFAPVAGEAFDLVISQPPFVPMPDGADAAAFLHGGRRGDEIARRLLAGLAPHLTTKGRALVMIEWPDDGSEPPAQRVRAAVGPDALHVLSIEGPTVNPEVYATAYTAAAHPRLDHVFEDEALRLREHLDRMKIRGLTLTLDVLAPARRAPAFTEALSVGLIARVGITSSRLDKIFAARALAAEPARLLTAKLRVPEGTVLAQEQIGPGAEVPSTLEARFPDGVLAKTIGLTLDLLGLITAVHEAPVVEAGIAAFAEASEVPFEEARGALLPAVAEALRHGLLEVTDIDSGRS
jgi:methylase of polypeptide subunit release factors